MSDIDANSHFAAQRFMVLCQRNGAIPWLGEGVEPTPSNLLARALGHEALTEPQRDYLLRLVVRAILSLLTVPEHVDPHFLRVAHEKAQTISPSGEKGTCAEGSPDARVSPSLADDALALCHAVDAIPDGVEQTTANHMAARLLERIQRESTIITSEACS